MNDFITGQTGFIFKVQFFVTAVAAAILIWLSMHSVISFLAGSAIITLNFWLLTVLWERVFNKKAVATTLILVITKYASLGVLLFLLINKWSLQLGPLIAGTTTLFGTFVIVALRLKILEKKNNAL